MPLFLHFLLLLNTALAAISDDIFTLSSVASAGYSLFSSLHVNRPQEYAYHIIGFISIYASSEWNTLQAAGSSLNSNLQAAGKGDLTPSEISSLSDANAMIAKLIEALVQYSEDACQGAAIATETALGGYPYLRYPYNLFEPVLSSQVSIMNAKGWQCSLLPYYTAGYSELTSSLNPLSTFSLSNLCGRVDTTVTSIYSLPALATSCPATTTTSKPILSTSSTTATAILSSPNTPSTRRTSSVFESKTSASFTTSSLSTTSTTSTISPISSVSHTPTISVSSSTSHDFASSKPSTSYTSSSVKASPSASSATSAKFASSATSAAFGSSSTALSTAIAAGSSSIGSFGASESFGTTHLSSYAATSTQRCLVRPKGTEPPVTSIQLLY